MQRISFNPPAQIDLTNAIIRCNRQHQLQFVLISQLFVHLAQLLSRTQHSLVHLVMHALELLLLAS
jgi:hypothetical protein